MAEEYDEIASNHVVHRCPMSSVGFSAEIHKVADNGKRLALFLGATFFFVWVVAVNMSINDLTPRWFQREFDWLASDSIPPVFLSMALASLISAGCIWLFSGNGNKLFDIDATGITNIHLWRSKSYGWADFELLEREVSTIILHLRPEARGKYGPNVIKFDLSAMDCSGPRLEALIVHYRPDLFRTLYVARPAKAAEGPAPAQVQPEAEKPVTDSPYSQRMARIRS
jgi:hypothetical protein